MQLEALKKLQSIYEVEYYAILEKLRLKHHDYVKVDGKTSLKKPFPQQQKQPAQLVTPADNHATMACSFSNHA